MILPVDGMKTNRRAFIKQLGVGVAGLALSGCARGQRTSARNRPNIILCMTDDQGWGDTGYNGHPVLQTPTLDEMARTGVRFNRFYSGAPVCSPTRGSCMTGRHPYRYGILSANVGHMKPQELTLAEVLRQEGYTTGHFGKWHLGTLTKTVKDSNRGGPRGVEHYSTPSQNGFDVYFSTEAKVPTWDPMVNPETGKVYGTRYWREDGSIVEDNLQGDDSRIIMDRVVPFVRDAVKSNTPFFAVVWFHSPHLPVVTGGKYAEMYKDEPEYERNFYGCVTAMDEQVGRLRKELRSLGVAENTMLWFCSDNGPEGKTNTAPGTTAGLRGRKRDLFEGGVRVPGLLEWPGRVEKPFTTGVPCSTSDYFPTICSALGIAEPGGPQPVDGIDLMPLIEGEMTERPRPIAFESRGRLALIDNRYKIVSTDEGKTYMLFDIIADPGEANDLASQKPELLNTMRTQLERWRATCAASRDGDDYDGGDS